MITINCETKDTLNLDELTEFQGELKKRTEKDVAKIIKSIRKHGFSIPFYVWKHDGINHVLDGHGRLMSLKSLKNKGEEIPPLPVVYVNCKDEAEAKELLLKINSQFGKMTSESVNDFLDGIEINAEDIALPSGLLDITPPKLEIEEEAEVPFTEEIGEENNYLVLFFDSSIDWIQVESLFNLKTVKSLGSKTSTFQQRGIGRVINGTKFIQKMIESEGKK